MDTKRNSRTIVSNREAKEQAADYFGFTAGVSIQLDNGKVFEIPNPAMLDDDQQERYEEFLFVLEQCDREEDIEVPERTLSDGTVLPAATVKGDLKKPLRINNELLKPSYNVRLAQVLFGEDGYADFKAAGGSGSQVALEWTRMNREFQERLDADSKSAGDDSAVEAVRAAN